MILFHHTVGEPLDLQPGQMGTEPTDGMGRWNNSHIVKVLKNEKYVANLTQKKSDTRII